MTPKQIHEKNKKELKEIMNLKQYKVELIEAKLKYNK